MEDPREPIEGEDLNVEDQDLESPEESDEGLEAGEQDAGVQDGEEEEGEEEQVDAAPPRRANRAQTRIQQLNQAAREQRERADRIERELTELRAAQRQAQQPQQESPEARAARRALMDPMEIMREDLRESEARTANLLRQQMIQTREATDHATFQSTLRERPALKKYEAEVEKVRKEQEAAGNFVPRQVLLELAVGRAALAAAGKAPKARQDGQRRVANQQVRPTRAGGDTATQRGRQGDTAEKRLEGVQI